MQGLFGDPEEPKTVVKKRTKDLTIFQQNGDLDSDVKIPNVPKKRDTKSGDHLP